MFSKSANPLNLAHKSTIYALFKAKSVDPKTYSPPSIRLGYLKIITSTVDCVHWNSNFIWGFMQLEVYSDSTDHETFRIQKSLAWFPHCNKKGSLHGWCASLFCCCRCCTVHDMFLKTTGQACEENVFFFQKMPGWIRMKGRKITLL